MAGASIKITVRDQALQQAMRRLGLEGEGLVTAALKNIGQQLVKSTRARFAAEQDPDGKPWTPLNPAYAAAKKGAQILQEQGMRGGLLGSIVYQLEDRRVLVGTNKIYGAVHQFGATIRPRTARMLAFRIGGRLVLARQVTVPARPYLGVSAADREEILAVVRDHIERAWER